MRRRRTVQPSPPREPARIEAVAQAPAASLRRTAAVPASRGPRRETGPSPDEALRRAQRLGHRVERRQLPPSPPSVQRYYTRDDLTQAENVPRGARISGDLNVVAEDKQAVYAGLDTIKAANAVLKTESRIALQPGLPKSYDIAVQTGPDEGPKASAADLYRVIPRYNPRVEAEDADLPRSYSGERGEDLAALRGKHEAYIKDLDALVRDFGALVAAVRLGSQTKNVAWQKGLASLDPTEWFKAINEWAGADPLRTEVLKAALNDIWGAFAVQSDPTRRIQDLQALAQRLAAFYRAETSDPSRIALPTDCRQAVRYVASGERVSYEGTLAADPRIGSNYYTDLPANAARVGWHFHWAGVILKDGGDNVTLESAGGVSLGSFGKDSWWMQMYGTRNVDQTFKKQLHLIHIERNREALVGKNDPKSTKSRLELDAQEQAVRGWTRLDSDQD